MNTPIEEMKNEKYIRKTGRFFTLLLCGDKYIQNISANPTEA